MVKHKIEKEINEAFMYQEFLRQERENLLKEIPELISVEFYEGPSRIMLVTTSALETLPEKEFKGVKIVFDQMTLGGVIVEKESKIQTEEKTQDPMGTIVPGPHSQKAKDQNALKAWMSRHSAVKIMK